MPSDPFTSAINILKDVRAKSDAILVGFSGGKESLCVLDLAVRAGFQRVQPYYLETIPGLAVADQRLAIAKERYGLTVLRYPGPNLFAALATGSYSLDLAETRDLPTPSADDIQEIIRQDTGIPYTAVGMRKADSLSRRRAFARNMIHRMKITPLKDWTKWDVLSYLKVHDIPVPQQPGGRDATSDIGLACDQILWLHDLYPDDYAKAMRLYPFLDAVVARRRYYGVGQTFTKETSDGQAKAAAPAEGGGAGSRDSPSPTSGPGNPL